MARVPADPSADLGVVRHASAWVHAALALLVLLAATVLAVYTPRGEPRHNRLCWLIEGPRHFVSGVCGGTLA
jgi:bacteriorhodopsin